MGESGGGGLGQVQLTDVTSTFTAVVDSSGALKTTGGASVADATQSGTISGNTSVTLALTGQASVTVQTVNTGLTGTLNFETSDDSGATWHAVAVWPVGSTASGNLIVSQAFASDSTSNMWEGNVSASSNVRVRGSSVSAGSTAVQIRAGQSTSSVVLDGPLPAGSNTIGGVTGTFWQATQPVSGTVTTTPPANASTNVAQVNGTTADTNSGAKSAGTLRVVLATDQPALTNKLLVDGSGVTQPVSGTVSTTPPANQSTNVAQVAGTTTDTNSGTKSAGTLRVVLATDQPALTNKLLVTPDSVALPANQSVNQTQWAGNAVTLNAGASDAGTLRVSLGSGTQAIGALTANQSTNVAQVAGTTTDTNSGTKSAGTLRVVLATDQPQLTAKLLVTPDSVALPANQSVNNAQVAGTAMSVNNGTADAGTTRVTIASNSTGQVALAAGSASVGTVLTQATVTATALASGAHTTTQTSADLSNIGSCRLHVIVNVTANTSGSITVTINGKSASGVYYPLLTGVAIAASGASTTVYRVGPAFTSSSNATANDMVPGTLQIVATANNANSMTYSVDYSLGA